MNKSAHFYPIRMGILVDKNAHSYAAPPLVPSGRVFLVFYLL